MRKGTASGKSGVRKARMTMTPEQIRKTRDAIDWKRLRTMANEEIERNAQDDPDSIVPLASATEPQLVPALPEVAALRRRLGLSQVEFAARFGFSAATVRNWEQGRVVPDGPARVLLAVIEKEPKIVDRALRPPVHSPDSEATHPRKGMSEAPGEAKFIPESAGQTAEVPSRKVVRDLPINWAREPLSEFWDASMNNVVANFAHDQPDVRLLRQIDNLFSRIAQNLLEPQNPLTALLLLRAHSTFRCASLVSMTGMPTEVYPLSRAILEQAGYALLIHAKPGLGEVWLRRHDGSTEKKAVRKAFTPAEIRELLGKTDKGLQKVFDTLYEYSIDCGGHPNERSLTSNLSLTERGRTKAFKVQYLHGNTTWVKAAIRNTARSGLFALFAFQHTMAARFQLLGIRDEMNSLRVRL